jgi:uroporphyrinogen-III synthase
VLVTRPRGQASALADLLTAEGAVPIVIPTIEIGPPASWCALDAALVTLRTYDWLLFTSANAVHAFAARARTLGLSAEARQIAVIGSATAKAVQAVLGRQPDLMPERFVAEDFVEVLRPYSEGTSMLLVRAAVSRDVLPEALEAAGAQVTVAQAYRNVVPEDSVAELASLFRGNPPDAITFTSASTARNLADLLEVAGLRVPGGVVLASIGPITSAAMVEAGFGVSVEARDSTVAGLVEALRDWFRREPPSSRSGSER